MFPMAEIKSILTDRNTALAGMAGLVVGALVAVALLPRGTAATAGPVAAPVSPSPAVAAPPR